MSKSGSRVVWRPVLVAQNVSRPRTKSRGAVIRIVQLATVQGQTAATNATIQPVTHTCQGFDTSIKDDPETVAYPRPVGLCRCTPAWQGCQLALYFCQRKPQALRNLDKGQSPNFCAGETPLPAGITDRTDQAFGFIKSDC